MMKSSLKLLVFLVGLLAPICMGINLSDGTKCADDEVACADRTKCVHVSKLCDYENDCSDSSDELNFSFCKELTTLRQTCPHGQVQCTQARSQYRYLSNECMDVVTACKLGKRCLKNTHMCEGINVGRLMPSDHTQAKDNEFENLMKFIAQSLNQTLQLNISSCPPFYSLYREKCISLFTPIQVSWAEAKLFCESTLGSLIILDDIQKFKEILDHLKENSINSSFWIGASANETLHDAWTWNDEKSVELGAPFWAVAINTWSHSSPVYTTEYHCEKKLLPQNETTRGRCLAILNENHYYFSNEDCSNKMSPICIAAKNPDAQF